jgi:hypothetical protein
LLNALHRDATVTPSKDVPGKREGVLIGQVKNRA